MLLAIVKGIAAGVVALVSTVFVVFFCVTIALFWIARRDNPTGAIGWDPISLVHQSPMVWIVLVLIFVGAFVWEFRRALR